MSIPAVSMNEHGASESGDGAPKGKGGNINSQNVYTFLEDKFLQVIVISWLV